MNLHVISTNYNSLNFCVNNINSIASQTFKPASHVFIDESDDENTRNILKQVKNSDFYNQAHELYGLEIILKESRSFKIKNLLDQINKPLYDDNDIICIVDGDDWLSNNYVLKTIYDSYNHNSYDYLYTNWVYSNANLLGCSKKIPDNNWDPYKDSWITSHMSTFKVSCFRNINPENFLDENKNWFEMGCDQAYILPILYNSKENHGSYDRVGHIDFPCYVYQHSENPLRKRDGVLGKKAHDAVSIIRKRGYIK